MPIQIFQYDGNLLTTIQDYSVDTTISSLKLVGDGYLVYGETILEDLVWLTENFADINPPKSPLQGQCWFDTKNQVMRVYNSGVWSASNGTVITDVKPASGFNQGALWYDTYNQQLNVWNGNNWDLVGPISSSKNNDPVSNTIIPEYSKIDAITLSDQANVLHQVFRITVGDTIVAIINKDTTFTPFPPVSGFSTIIPGINISTILVQTVPDPTIFRQTQDNLPSIDNFYDMGSQNQSFKYLFGLNGNFSNVYLNSSFTSNALVINGTSQFNGTTTFNSTVTFNSSSNTPPITINQGNLVTELVPGAIEFDGQQLYGTSFINGQPFRNNFAIGTVSSSGTWGAIFSGIANNIVATISPAPPSAIPVGTLMFGIAPFTNTLSQVFITVNSFGAVNLFLSDGITLPSVGSLIAGHSILLQWNGNSWLYVADLTVNGGFNESYPYLSKSGGTLSGPIVLPGNPTSNLQVAPKQYMDAAVSSFEYQITNLKNGSSNININNYMPLTGGTMTGNLSIPSVPTISSQMASKSYVDGLITKINPSGLYPLTGNVVMTLQSLYITYTPTAPLNAVNVQYLTDAISAFDSNTTPTSLISMQSFNVSSTYTPTAEASLVFAVVGDTAGKTVFGRTAAVSTSITIGAISSFGTITTSSTSKTNTSYKNMTGYVILFEYGKKS